MEPQHFGQDGTSPETAVAVNSVAEEYDWLRKHQPGFRLKIQTLTECDGKPYDVLRCTNDAGELRTFYFDISPFFGQRRRDRRKRL